jgi:hypothetical protein
VSPTTWLLLAVMVVASASMAVYSARRLAGATPAVAQVQVMNGSGVAELAQRAADVLRRHGIDVVAVGNADASDYAETLVLLRRGRIAVAHEVRAALGRGRVLEQRDGTLLVDVTVILGRDYDERAAER